jgi:hypothetical protein
VGAGLGTGLGQSGGKYIDSAGIGRDLFATLILLATLVYHFFFSGLCEITVIALPLQPVLKKKW